MAGESVYHSDLSDNCDMVLTALDSTQIASYRRTLPSETYSCQRGGRAKHVRLFTL